MNKLAHELAKVCREHLLREKWLIAPSRRVGYQWLDRLALAGESAANVHIKTLRSMAVDLASPAMVDQQVSLVTSHGAPILMARVLSELSKGGLRYLKSATVDQRLAETVLSSIESVRLAGLDALELDHKALEVQAKGEDLATIAAQYAEVLAGEQLVDFPKVLRMAIDRVTSKPACVGDDAIVLVPDDLSLSTLERQFLESIPPRTGFHCRQICRRTRNLRKLPNRI